MAAAEEEEPRTRPWPLNLEEGEEEKGLLTFLMRPFILSFTSSIAEREGRQGKLESRVWGRRRKRRGFRKNGRRGRSWGETS